jgi:hypothetical protein
MVSVTQLQTRLGLVADGQFGPKSRAAVLAALTDPVDRPIANSDVKALAARWGVEPAVVWTVRDVEAGGAGFIDGRPAILFEPHRFSRATGGRYDAVAPTISYPTWGTRPYPRAQADRYAQLLTAIALDVDAGFASASYGAFQIMGENYAACGETDSMAFALAEARGEDVQLRHFGLFCESKGLERALRRKDWSTFARGYNGSGQVDLYSGKLAAAYAKRSSGQ